MHPDVAPHFYDDLALRLNAAKRAGLPRVDRVIVSPQGPEVLCEDGVTRINMCANNYLGLSGSNTLVEHATGALRQFGYGLSSVRFICGTQSIHKELEERLAEFLGMEDAILYASAFDANTGLFEPLFDDRDAIISDALNHASIIDGIRLSRAARLRYAHDDMSDLTRRLVEAEPYRHKVIATDGVFSMDGTIAQLDHICDLAERHGALVMIDDCHATGFLGRTGRGTHEHHGVMGRVDIITGTLGKALGGAMGGFTAGRKLVIETLRRHSRPYLFSNSLAPAIVATTLHVLHTITLSTVLRDRLLERARYFRSELSSVGFAIPFGTHPIVPILVYEADVAQRLATRLYELGVLVVGFAYPVVPRGRARVRVQVSAAHSRAQLDQAVAAFETAGRELELLSGRN